MVGPVIPNGPQMNRLHGPLKHGGQGFAPVLVLRGVKDNAPYQYGRDAPTLRPIEDNRPYRVD